MLAATMQHYRIDPAAFVARLCGEPRRDLSGELGVAGVGDGPYHPERTAGEGV